MLDRMWPLLVTANGSWLSAARSHHGNNRQGSMCQERDTGRDPGTGYWGRPPLFQWGAQVGDTQRVGNKDTVYGEKSVEIVLRFESFYKSFSGSSLNIFSTNGTENVSCCYHGYHLFDMKRVNSGPFRCLTGTYMLQDKSERFLLSWTETISSFWCLSDCCLLSANVSMWASTSLQQTLWDIYTSHWGYKADRKETTMTHFIY